MKVLDLFCGAGGLSLGFALQGFEIVGAFDSWKTATETYEKNFDHQIFHEPITFETELPQADIIVGGPPCQGFSSAGLRMDQDSRNTMVSVFSDLVVKNRPRAFVFENVEGFLTGRNGYFLFELLGPLIKAGYRIHLRKVNAANFGVPQHRKRVLAIGALDWDPSFPEFTHSTVGAPGADLLNIDRLPFSPSISDALAGLPKAQAFKKGMVTAPSDHYFTPFGEDDSERAKHLKQRQSMRDLPEHLWHQSFKKRANRRVSDGTPSNRRGGPPSGLRRLCEKEPSKAITGGALREFVHPLENRPLTIRECARLQTFPDDYVFAGTMTQKIQMIGNAVPTLLAQAIARNLKLDFQKPNENHNGGALLSFVPTASMGKSPVLQSVTDRVHREYMHLVDQQESLCL